MNGCFKNQSDTSHSKDSSCNSKYKDNGKGNNSNIQWNSRSSDHKDVYCQLSSIGNYSLHGIILGKGNFANVVLATHKIIGAAVALKIIDINKTKERYVLQNLEREARVLARLNHPNIVKLYEALWCNNLYCIALEYVSGENLSEYIKKLPDRRLNERKARIFFRQILAAVNHIHRHNILHRDLKLENIMLEDGEVIKLVDFGLSNFYDHNNFLRTQCGSPEYAAPELFQHKVIYGPAVDMWSLGVILYVLVLGHVPFPYLKKESSTLQGRRKKLHLRSSKGLIETHMNELRKLSPSCTHLIQGMLQPDQNYRISLETAQKHKWLQLHIENPASTNHSDPNIYRQFYPMVIQRIATLTSTSVAIVEQKIKDPYKSFHVMYHILMDFAIKHSRKTNPNDIEFFKFWNNTQVLNSRPFYSSYLSQSKESSNIHTHEKRVSMSAPQERRADMFNQCSVKHMVAKLESVIDKNKIESKPLKTPSEKKSVSKVRDSVKTVSKNILNKLGGLSHSKDNGEVLSKTSNGDTKKEEIINLRKSNQRRMSLPCVNMSNINFRAQLLTNATEQTNNNLSVRPKIDSSDHTKFDKVSTIKKQPKITGPNVLNVDQKDRMKKQKPLSADQSKSINTKFDNQDSGQKNSLCDTKIAILKRPTQILKRCDNPQYSLGTKIPTSLPSSNLECKPQAIKKRPLSHEKTITESSNQQSKSEVERNTSCPYLGINYNSHGDFDKDRKNKIEYTPRIIASDKSKTCDKNATCNINSKKQSSIQALLREKYLDKYNLPIFNKPNPRWANNTREPNLYQKFPNYLRETKSSSCRQGFKTNYSFCRDFYELRLKYDKDIRNIRNTLSTLASDKTTPITNMRRNLTPVSSYKPSYWESTANSTNSNTCEKYSSNYCSRAGNLQSNKQQEIQANRFGSTKMKHSSGNNPTLQQVQTNSRTENINRSGDGYKRNNVKEPTDSKATNIEQSTHRYSVIRNQEKNKNLKHNKKFIM